MATAIPKIVGYTLDYVRSFATNARTIADALQELNDPNKEVLALGQIADAESALTGKLKEFQGLTYDRLTPSAFAGELLSADKWINHDELALRIPLAITDFFRTIWDLWQIDRFLKDDKRVAAIGRDVTKKLGEGISTLRDYITAACSHIEVQGQLKNFLDRAFKIISKDAWVEELLGKNRPYPSTEAPKALAKTINELIHTRLVLP